MSSTATHEIPTATLDDVVAAIRATVAQCADAAVPTIRMYAAAGKTPDETSDVCFVNIISALAETGIPEMCHDDTDLRPVLPRIIGEEVERVVRQVQDEVRERSPVFMMSVLGSLRLSIGQYRRLRNPRFRRNVGRPTGIRNRPRRRRAAIGSSSSSTDPPQSEGERSQRHASPQAGAGRDLDSGTRGAS